VWSLPDQPVHHPTKPNTQNAGQYPVHGSFGRPGLMRSGEHDSFAGSDQAETVQTGGELVGAPEKPENEIVRTVETLRPDEISQATQNPTPQEEAPQERQAAQAVKPLAQGEIVDHRTGKVRTHRVEGVADKTTKTADMKEQEFIEGVEQIHSIV